MNDLCIFAPTNHTSMFFWRKKKKEQPKHSHPFDLNVLSSADKTFYAENGYLVMDTGVPEETIDAVLATLQPYWEGEEPKGVSYADPNRIQDAWKINQDIHGLACNKKVLGALYDLYGKKPLPFQTLNFPHGTEQPVHSDSIHFNSEPFGMMCGVWVALEDIGPDQGPLIYYPGSNNWPEMNFEDMGLEPDYGQYSLYEKKLQALIDERELEPHYATIKKGQALIWSANLLHGGSKQHDKNLTRHSQVTHYFFEGCKPWRPGHSSNGRAYFEPQWIAYGDN